MSDFKVIGRSRRRSFKLTIGLEPGYDAGTGAAAETTYQVRYRSTADSVRAWLASQSAAGRPFLNGTLTRGLRLYTRPHDPSLRMTARAYAEEVAVFAGEVSPVHLADTPDAEIEFALTDLAKFLCERCEQTRIYVAYAGETWVVQRGDAPT